MNNKFLIEIPQTNLKTFDYFKVAGQLLCGNGDAETENSSFFSSGVGKYFPRHREREFNWKDLFATNSVFAATPDEGLIEFPVPDAVCRFV